MLELVKPLNFILAADAYKFLHWREINPTVKQTWVVCVPRSKSEYSDEIVAMGLTFVAHVLSTVRVTDAMIDEAEVEITEQGYEFNREGWEHIAHSYGGRLPLAMFGVEEGRIVKPQTPVLGLTNTDSRSNHPSPWLPAYVESWVQGVVWKMSSVASTCRAARLLIAEYMELTGADMSMLDYKLHFFGNRATTPEDAVLSGMSHAALFSGSDCSEANSYIKKLYNTNKAYTSSVEATEHATACSCSDAINRDDSGAAKMAVERLYAAVERANRGVGIPVISTVIDTYDSRRFVRKYLGIDHKEAIIASGGKLVARPDSGDVLVEPGMVVRDLMATFGYTFNAKGFVVLNPAVGVLQGDGVKIYTIRPILQALVAQLCSIDNIVLGMGHGCSNEVARDDFSWSMKAVADSDGVSWTRMKKEPVTDSGKNSLSGLVRCRENDDGELEVFDALVNGQQFGFMLPTSGWRLYSIDGRRKWRTSFDDVQLRAKTA